MRQEKVFHVHRSRPHFPGWGFEPATSQTSLRYAITLWAYRSELLICLSGGEIITTKSLSLLSGLYHRSCYYCHNGLQRDAENRLIYFSFITFQIAATLSPRLSICLYECACALDQPIDYFIISEFHFFDSHNFIIGPSLSFSLTIRSFFLLPCNCLYFSFMAPSRLLLLKTKKDVTLVVF